MCVRRPGYASALGRLPELIPGKSACRWFPRTRHTLESKRLWTAVDGLLRRVAGGRLSDRGSPRERGAADFATPRRQVRPLPRAHVPLCVGRETTRRRDRLDLLAEHGVDHPLIDDGHVAEQVRSRFPDGIDAGVELVGTPTLPDTLAAMKVHGTVCFVGMLSNEWIVRDFYPIDYLLSAPTSPLADRRTLRQTLNDLGVCTASSHVAIRAIGRASTKQSGSQVLTNPRTTRSSSPRPLSGIWFVSEGGLEPPREIISLAPQASASAIPPLRRGVTRISAGSGPHQQEAEGDDGEDPDQCEHERDAVQVAFGGR